MVSDHHTTEKTNNSVSFFFCTHANTQHTKNTLPHTHKHTHPQPVHTDRHKQRQTCLLIRFCVSSIIQHSAHRHRLKEDIKHVRGPHLEITRTLPVFKMQRWELKIDLGWLSLFKFLKYTNYNHWPFAFSTPQSMGLHLSLSLSLSLPKTLTKKRMMKERRRAEIASSIPASLLSLYTVWSGTFDHGAKNNNNVICQSTVCVRPLTDH